MTTMKVSFWKGQLIELQSTEKNVYRTQIMNLDDERLYIQTPVNLKKEVMEVKSGQQVKVYFQSEENEFCVFEDRLSFYNDRLVIRIPNQDEIKSAQRRHFFRVPAMLDLTIQAEEEVDPEKELVPLINALPPLKTRDISGGGLSFICPIKLPIDQRITGKVHLFTQKFDKEIEFEAQVVISRKNRNNFVVSCEFINMTEATRQEVMQFCINRQIELKKKLG